MFRGSSNHTIDEKGRFIIPTRFRDVIRAKGEETLMISKMDGCLVAYPMDEWSKIEERLLATVDKSAKMRRFRRIFIGAAFKCQVDRQGRVLIPPVLREYGALDKEISLVGVLDHFEIWSKEKLDLEEMHHEEDLKEEDFSNEIAKLGL
ncbi:MAG: division/cell wall cluster transcriptional repressor MraZ [Desulfobacterales bacterium]|nr:division/cell wall cluster transcriptional repressor MraZ [Desulfobacterales bacterium]